MMSIIVLLCAFASPSPPPNLLLNPGFEAVDLEGMPAPWGLFVMPNKGAGGRVDSVALRGRSSVMLYTPEPYPTEPANNWSQVIITDAASKELHLRGFIRTEDATEAALWLQCFSRNPARVVAAQTSSLELPVRGTTGWTEVRLAITAPQQTDFLVVRCVLTGTGKAWFDAIELRVGDHSISPLEGLEPSEETVGADSQEDLVREVLALGESIQQSMRELEAANASLLEQIASLRRTSVIDRRPAPLVPSIVSPPLLEPLATGPVRHPLVPHGYLEGIVD